MELWATVRAGSSGGRSECENLSATIGAMWGGKHQVSLTLGRICGGVGDEPSGDRILEAYRSLF